MREYKNQDRTAPRFFPARTSILTKKFYSDLRKKYPQYKGIADKDLGHIVETFNQMLYTEAVESRDGVELPEGLGFIFIGTCSSPKKNNRDYATSAALEVQVRHRNFESDNYLAKIFYTNYGKYRFQNREVWMFRGCTKFRKLVADTYPENWKKYLQVDNYTRVSRIFRKKSSRLFAIQNPREIPETYNEFQID